MTDDLSGLPSGLMSITTLTAQLAQADDLFRHGDLLAALRQYQAVQHHIEGEVKREQGGISTTGTVIGGIVGALVPGLNLITVPLGAYLGYKATQHAAMASLADTPYYDLYLRAVKGVMAVSERRVKG